jgi:hypothetical protein
MNDDYAGTRDDLTDQNGAHASHGRRTLPRLGVRGWHPDEKTAGGLRIQKERA